MCFQWPPRRCIDKQTTLASEWLCSFYLIYDHALHNCLQVLQNRRHAYTARCDSRKREAGLARRKTAGECCKLDREGRSTGRACQRAIGGVGESALGGSRELVLTSDMRLVLASDVRLSGAHRARTVDWASRGLLPVAGGLRGSVGGDEAGVAGVRWRRYRTVIDACVSSRSQVSTLRVVPPIICRPTY
jgi:hypothetical protein